MQDLELKRKRIENGVQILGIAVVGFFIAPYVVLAIGGLVGGAVALALAWFLSRVLTPWFGAKIANWRVKAIKHEASLNPIETMQNEYRMRSESLNDFRQAIEKFATEHMGFGEKLEGFKRQFPNEAAKFDAQHKKMGALLEIRWSKYNQAKVALVNFDAEIDKARAIYEMAKAAAAMTEASGIDSDEFMRKIQTETAFDTVQLSMNSAFAALELELREEQSDAQAALSLPSAKNPVGASIPVAIASTIINR